MPVKLEIRNPKSETNPNSKDQNPKPSAPARFERLDFDL
jgi:hypothetical protein